MVRPYKQAHGGVDDGDEDADAQDGLQDNMQQNPAQARISISKEAAEARFTKEELAKIQKEFERLSKDNVIGKRKLLEYFRLTDVSETYLSNEIFFMIKNSSVINSPIDYSKFITFVSTVAKGSREEKLSLLYTFFDKSVDSKISKDDLKAHISGTILSMQQV